MELTARLTRKPDPDAGLLASDLAMRTGVSLRQLQWWDERGVVSPRQECHKRVYTPEETRIVSIVADLRKRGVSLQQIRSLLRFKRRSDLELKPGSILIYSRRRWRVVEPECALNAILETPGQMIVSRIP